MSLRGGGWRGRAAALCAALAVAAACTSAGAPSPAQVRETAPAPPPVQRVLGQGLSGALPPGPAAPGLPAQEFQVAATPDHPAYVLLAPGASSGERAAPRRGLLALHGIGEDGRRMAAAVRELAHAHGWVVVAPTLAYGNWQDPAQVASEAARLQPQLARLVDAVSAETGISLAERLLVLGFSRGAQAALRFTMLYPERVQAVAALSAGTYTLPLRTVNTVAGPVAAPFPFGIADVEQRTGRSVDLERMAQARFWIGVGGADTNESEVPRQWDPFVGRHRVERAERFAAALAQLGCDVQFAVVPGAGHRLTPPMLEQAGRFLASAAEAPP